MSAEQQAEAQQVLDNLLQESLIPFPMRIGCLVDHGPSGYRVQFYDSRIRDVEFDWPEGESFKDAFRAAVLGRVAKMSGPLFKD